MDKPRDEVNLVQVVPEEEGRVNAGDKVNLVQVVPEEEGRVNFNQRRMLHKIRPIMKNNWW